MENMVKYGKAYQIWVAQTLPGSCLIETLKSCDYMYNKNLK